DGGATWQAANSGLPSRTVRGFTGGSDKTRKLTALYCTLGNQGVFKSTDGAGTWIQVKGLPAGREFVFAAMSREHPDICYVTDRGRQWTVYKTTDGGMSWTSCFRGPARSGYSNPNVELSWLAEWTWGWGGPAIGFNVNHANPDVAMYTNTGELYITQDGGKSWYQAQSGKAEQPNKWYSIGLEVTTCWHYDIDPNNPQYHYICYTDIGFARSDDGGRTWEHRGRFAPWGNTFYQLAFEPTVPGKVFTAASNVHDIGGWGFTDPARTKGPGGVALSEDYGYTWKAVSEGLPNAPCTSIVMDMKSPPQNRTLYAAMVGHGVYKTTDGARTWVKKSSGLGTSENMHVYALHLDRNGTLYCTVTASRTGTSSANWHWGRGSGIWRSRDGGESWEWITESLDLGHALEMDVHPENPNIILLAAIDLPQPKGSQGGLYMTTDGGANWRRILSKSDFTQTGFVHVFKPTFHPKKPNIVYLSTWTHGLWVSVDGGRNWQEFKDMPVSNPLRIGFDPRDDNVIYVTSYGKGVRKGPALPGQGQ
ncbi:MAG TPA: hypothetical protein ENN09_00290, partial [Planctomycetes bacterium]|nr:hypothetical protein [Planctomycetota bacterium]